MNKAIKKNMTVEVYGTEKVTYPTIMTASELKELMTYTPSMFKKIPSEDIEILECYIKLNEKSDRKCFVVHKMVDYVTDGQDTILSIEYKGFVTFNNEG